MSLATHDLIQASPLCSVPLPLFSSYFLLLCLWLSLSLLFLSMYKYLSYRLMMKGSRRQFMSQSFKAFMVLIACHVSGCRFTVLHCLHHACCIHMHISFLHYLRLQLICPRKSRQKAISITTQKADRQERH